MGGLARIDVIDHPGGTIYLTVWASTYINLHMGGSGSDFPLVFSALQWKIAAKDLVVFLKISIRSGLQGHARGCPN
jgi:hypothetical protein